MSRSILANPLGYFQGARRRQNPVQFVHLATSIDSIAPHGPFAQRQVHHAASLVSGHLVEYRPVVFVDRDVDALAHCLILNQESLIISLRKAEFHLAEPLAGGRAGRLHDLTKAWVGSLRNFTTLVALKQQLRTLRTLVKQEFG